MNLCQAYIYISGEGVSRKFGNFYANLIFSSLIFISFIYIYIFLPRQEVYKKYERVDSQICLGTGSPQCWSSQFRSVLAILTDCSTSGCCLHVSTLRTANTHTLTVPPVVVVYVSEPLERQTHIFCEHSSAV